MTDAERELIAEAFRSIANIARDGLTTAVIGTDAEIALRNILLGALASIEILQTQI